MPAAVQFGEDAVEANLLLDLAQPRGEAMGLVNQDLRRERLVIGQRLEPLDPAQPLRRDLAAGAPCRIAPELGLIAEKAHQALLGLLPGALPRFGKVGRDPEEDLAAPLVAG